MNEKQEQIESIAGVVENIFTRNEMLEDPEALKKIGIFVLLIGKLEYQIKTLLLLSAGNPETSNLDNMTLGVAIKELEKRLPNIKSEYDENPRDYRYKNFLQRDNISRFISQCKEMNRLRNDLIHNFISPQKAGLENTSQILSQVEKMIIGADNWFAYGQGRISQEILAGKKTPDDLVDDQLHIRDHSGKIREDVPLNGLIEICQIFYQIMKHLNMRSKC